MHFAIPVVILRLLSIIWWLVRYNLIELLPPLPQPWRSLIWLFQLLTFPFRSRERHLPRGKRLALAMEKLGPLFVKLGQLLSTRRDLLPNDITENLVRLRDNVQPFSYRQVEALIKKNFGLSVEEVFVDFSPEPIASASIAQVHLARIESDAVDAEQQVAVKVLRPNIRKIIARDLYVLDYLFSLVQRHFHNYHHLNLIDISKELERILSNETDLRIESANCSVLRRQAQGSKLLYIPQVYWDYTRIDVMVMEAVHGISIDDLQQLRKHNVDLRQLAQLGVDLFIEQVFNQEMFHADMHPGNIYVDVSQPDSPSFIAVDFGMVGSLNDFDKQYLARNLMAFFRRDYARVAQLHSASGWLLQDHNGLHDFATSLRNVCEPIFERPANEISFGELLQRLFTTARRFEVQIQPQLLLLQKTFLNVEGIGRYLYPELNLWISSRNKIEKWVAEQLSAKRNIKNIGRACEDVLWAMPSMGLELRRGMRKLEKALHSVDQISDRLDRIQKQQYGRRIQRWFFALGCLMWLSAISVLLLPANSLPWDEYWIGLPALSWVSFVIGLLAIFFSWPGWYRSSYPK